MFRCGGSCSEHEGVDYKLDHEFVRVVAECVKYFKLSVSVLALEPLIPCRCTWDIYHCLFQFADVCGDIGGDQSGGVHELWSAEV